MASKSFTDFTVLYVPSGEKKEETNMILTQRLKLIYSIIPKCNTIADIGTDHGYIPIYCTLNGVCKAALAMDVNEGPLERAQAHIDKYNLGDKISTRLSDGLQKLAPGEADVVVIAGMGGPLIAEIIESGKNVVTDNTTLILQPMIAPKELREYLYGSEFEITDEYVCREENKFYNIFKVKKGNFEPSQKDLFIGRNLKQNSPDDFGEYIEYKIRVAQKILNGLKKSTGDKSADIALVENELKIYREELK